MTSTCRRLFRKSFRLLRISYRTKTIHPRKSLQGLVVAPFTAFDKRGDVDFQAVPKCLDYFKKVHFDGLFVNGTLGEGMSLSQTERKLVADKWMDLVANQFFVILHIGTGNIRDTQDLARHAENLGVDAIATLPPTYHKPPDEEQLVKYLQEVSSAAPNTPLLYYEYNIASGVYLNIPKMLELASGQVPTLYGLKHTSPELNSALNCSTASGGRYKVFFGTETQYLPTLSLGIPDVITSPYLGALFYSMKAAFDAGDLTQAQTLQKKAQQLINIQTRHGGGITVAKVMFELLSGIQVGDPRIPISTLTLDQRTKLHQDLINDGFMSAS